MTGWGRLLGLFAALAFATAAQAQVVETPEAALARDAGTWGAVAGLSPDEAARQLRVQRDTVAVTDALQAEFDVRLAGIAVEHQAGFLVRVLLTGDAPVADRRLVIDAEDVAIEFRTGALASRAQLLAALTQHQAAIRAMLRRPPGLGVDARSGALVVLVASSELGDYAPGELEQRLADLTGVPTVVRPLDAPTSNSAIEGGARVVGTDPADGKRYACTSGFVVTNGVRDGLVTAAHCPDTLAFIEQDRSEVPLTYLGQWGWSFQDVQLHVADAALAPQFFADTGRTLARVVTGARARASTRVGDIVCHRGERTGYSCAEVQFVDFAPAGDLCGGPCAPTWVAVAGPDCRSGDSGGPVFDGAVALGIVKGSSTRPDGTCALYYYQSTDYLPTGWRVMTAGDEPAQPSLASSAPSR